MSNVGNKISPLPTWRYTSKLLCHLHLRNSKKQRLIFNTFYITNAPFVNNQTAKFQLNLLKQTIATTAFVMLPPVSYTHLTLPTILRV